tara:strand:+ start:1182 stop:2066 length:885 start_codon:yes stop_codon:yes gene_type:complete
VANDSLFNQEFLAKLDYLYLISKKLLSGQNKAERRSRKIGSGIEFADYREYVPGDDLRHIDWNLYARLGKLFLRLFEEEEDLYVYILLDISPSMTLGSPSRLDYGRRVAAALAYITLNNLDRISMITFGDKLEGRLPPCRGKNNIFKVLQFLDALEPMKGTHLEESLRTFVHQTKRRGVAVVISDFYDEKGYESALNFLRYHKFDIYALQLFDQKELQPDIRGDVELVDHETGEVLTTTLSPALVRAYREAFEEFCEEIEQYCKRSEITLFRTDIQVPFEDLILNIFRQGGFLG